MKMIEITNRSILAELEKLNKQLDKARATLAKKNAAAEKYGVVEWGNEEHRAWLQTVKTTEHGFIESKEDIKKNGAWFDMVMANDRVEEIEAKIENAEKRFAKSEAEVEAYHEEVAKLEGAKAAEELRKLEFEQEQKEWAKDGITLEERYEGKTPNGKRFYIYRNFGVTERSWHCFTLRIDGEVVFTSGEFWRAYIVVKNS